MTEKRFNIEDGYYQGKSRPMIYDDESSDDYYFCGDYEDFKSICKQFNDFDITNKHLKKENAELNNRLNKYIVDYNGLNCEWHWLKTEKEDLEKENSELKSLCKVLITHIEKKSIAFVIDEDIRRLFE